MCRNGEKSADCHYCGVYKQIMEDLLESECLSCNTSRHEYNECFDNLDTSDRFFRCLFRTSMFFDKITL